MPRVSTPRMPGASSDGASRLLPDDLERALDNAGLTRKQLLQGAAATAAAGSVAGGDMALARSPRTRDYWVGAVPVTWNVVPNGRDAIGGRPVPPDQTVFRTVVYRLFTRNWRRQLKAREDFEQGLQGPLLRGRVGDRLLVHFKNMDTEFGRPHSMHFHGVHYEPASDGAFIPRLSGRGGAVEVGETFTYRLHARHDSVGVWPYHDHSPSMEDSIGGGMYGALSIAARDAHPPDREFVVYFSSHLGLMTINGRAFLGNTPVFHARVGQMVQWDVLAIGDDFHTFHIHGHRWRAADGTFQDTRTLGPAESFAFRFKEDVPGPWLYHCHVERHMMNGMIGLYHVVR